MEKLRTAKILSFPAQGTISTDTLYLKSVEVSPTDRQLEIAVSAANIGTILPMLTLDKVAEIAADNVISHVTRVADIAERDSLVLTKNSWVVVTDASADPEVTSGEALYEYNHATTTFALYSTEDSEGWKLEENAW